MAFDRVFWPNRIARNDRINMTAKSSLTSDWCHQSGGLNKWRPFASFSVTVLPLLNCIHTHTLCASHDTFSKVLAHFALINDCVQLTIATICIHTIQLFAFQAIVQIVTLSNSPQHRLLVQPPPPSYVHQHTLCQPLDRPISVPLARICRSTIHRSRSPFSKAQKQLGHFRASLGPFTQNCHSRTSVISLFSIVGPTPFHPPPPHIHTHIPKQTATPPPVLYTQSQ